MCENKQTTTLKLLKDDPYKELELYLQKAQNEIGEIFQDATPTKANEHVTGITSNKQNKDDVTRHICCASTWINAKEPCRGVKVLAQLEALLHGLSRCQMETDSKPTPPQPVYTTPHTRNTPTRGNQHSTPPMGAAITSLNSNTPLERGPRAAQMGLKQTEPNIALDGDIQWAKGYDTRPIATPHEANMDALTAWVENLVDEMNSIGDEDKVKDRKRETLVHWLLSDLGESNKMDERRRKNVDCCCIDSDSEVFVDAPGCAFKEFGNVEVENGVLTHVLMVNNESVVDVKQRIDELPVKNIEEVEHLKEKNDDICNKVSSECHVSRLSSTTSTLSSTGSQMKPEDVQDFLRRVETSIWESESLKRRKKHAEDDSVLAAIASDQSLSDEDEDEDEFDTYLADVGTQTTPCLSRTCSLLLEEPNYKVPLEDSEMATVGSDRSMSCSSIDILSTLSVASSFGEDTTDVSSTDTARFNGESTNDKAKGAVKIMGNDTKVFKGYGKPLISEEDVWIKRENVQSQTKAMLSESNECTSSDSPFCETPSPQIVRETRSDSNISKTKSEKKLALKAPFSAPSSVAPSPMSEKSPTTAPVLESPSSVLNMFNIAPKSSSAPILDVRNLSLPRDGDTVDDDETHLCPSSPIRNNKVIPRLRSQSVKELTELEAVEACNWLRAAGFPQYAQMFEDSQFPINISAVQKDHYFLDADSLQSLFRRLNTLNKCARMRLDNIPRKSSVEDSDEEEQCALSENWTFQRQSRRWSRIPMCLDPCVSHLTTPQVVNGQKETLNNGHKEELDGPVFDSPLPMEEDNSGKGSTSTPLEDNTPDTPPLDDSRCSAFKRSGSDRLKDGARAFLRRMESFKSRRSKRRNREAVVISGPQVMDTDGMEQRVHQLSCVDLTPSPQLIHRMNMARNRSVSQTEDGSSPSDNNSSQSSTPSTRAKRSDVWIRGRSPSQPRSDSDPECSPPSSRPDRKFSVKECLNVRTGSFHLNHKDSDSVERKMKKRCFPRCENDDNSEKEGNETKEKNASERKSNCNVGMQQDSDSGSNMSTNPDFDAHKLGQTSDSNGQIMINDNQIRNTSVVSYRSSFTANLFSINALSAGQLMILRKLSLLKLTALMERYSPSNRSGWSWIMPKFIKRMKNPDYKDKVVFGVPLSVVHQRTGQPLPPSIQAAITFLKKNAVDSVGIFRKSGVRSRIQKLKNMCEANPINISYEGQQTYDVADMLKQYFREIPEALLTNKMSETFIAIYQYVPEELRLEALQVAVMLIPDENREILQKLLSFLYEVSLQAQENQMTASNLAVCFAPSLFHMNTCRGSSNSPRRRKTVGVPDQKELNENRAAHDCLSFMIREHKKIFSVSEDAIFQCRFSYIDDTEPFSMEEVMSLNGFESGTWKSYVHVCIQSLLKECREKVKGWMSMSTHENAELAFKKVGDGNPLRMWKASVEVEAPPVELLNRVLRERHLWDEQLVKWRVVCKLDSCSEVFNYVRNSMSPLPARDYCILRSWRTDLPKGACVLVESSVNLSESPLLLGNIRGVVMFSRYLIEPCGSGRSRITHISRVDTRGRSPEWYNRVYGHICALHLLRLGNSFRHNAEGPESKV